MEQRIGAPHPAGRATRGALDRLVRRLLEQAELFDDPRAYAAGVRDTVAALTAGRSDGSRGPSRAEREAVA